MPTLDGRPLESPPEAIDVRGPTPPRHGASGGERLLAAIVTDSDDAILSKTLDGTILTWNRSAERLYGYREAEAIGRNISMIVPSTRRGEEKVLLARLADGERIDHYETQRVSKTGEILDVAVTLSPLRGEDGRVVGASAITRDNTSGKRIDDELLRTGQRFRAMFERSGQGIAITTVDGLVVEVNRAMALILGYETPEEVYLDKVNVPSLYKNAAVRTELLATMRETDLLEGVETEICRRDGTVGWVSLNMVPILDSAGGISGLQTMATDITIKRSLERQLFQAQKMEAVGRLTGGIAHDFNNLLSVIVNYLDFALDSVEGQVQEDLQEVRHAADRAGALVRQLLTFSRRDVVVPEVLDLNERIRETQRLLERTLGEDIQLQVDLDPTLWHVELDVTHVEQILMNLAVNARDSMLAGGKLSIRTENSRIDEVVTQQQRDLSPGNYVCITISDTGAGMSQETIAHLFEPFYTTKAREVGTGLGLATVHGIVSNGGGAVHVYSEQGIGSTFRIYLPATDAVLPEAAEEEDGALGGTERLLVVDDEPALARVTGRVLEEGGYRVQVATSAREALEISQAQDVELLVTDVVMPALSGLDLALRVKSTHPGSRVLLMSGYSEDLLAHRGFFNAEHRLLTKPFSAQQLLRAVRATLDEKDDPAAARWDIRTPTVLVILDSEDVWLLFRRRLEEAGYSVVGTPADSADGVNAARRLRPQYVVLDVMMPGPSSSLIAAALRNEHPDVQILAVAGTTIEKPTWADAFLPKTRLDDLKEAMSSLEVIPQL